MLTQARHARTGSLNHASRNTNLALESTYELREGGGKGKGKWVHRERFALSKPFVDNRAQDAIHVTCEAALLTAVQKDACALTGVRIRAPIPNGP